MKTLHKILLTCILLIVSVSGMAQNKEDIKALIDRGVALNDSGKYTEAIDKYKEALKLDPENLRAQYEMSYTLTSCGRAKEAIPILEKIAASNTYPEAYTMLGDIYDDAGDFEKSLAYYRSGLVAFPKNSRLYLNLGIFYLRQKKYVEAETTAIEAIKLEPKHASNHRIYALATYYQDKGVPSIMAFCNFLMLEPQSPRSAEAYKYIQKIFQSKIKIDTAKGANKSMTITVHDNKSGDEDELTLETFLSFAAATPTLEEQKNKAAVELLNEQLSSIFKVAGELSAKRKAKDFFWNFYVGYFYQLAQSDNMPAFTRLINLSANKDENLKWFKDNDSKLTALDHWVANTKREF
jgi:tetratricopeptide (TPR) repeat protein